MPEPVLLQSKLIIPPLRPDALSRKRLTERLTLQDNLKLVLVSAPAGFGKTTLVIDWLQSEEQMAAWLSLDAEDNDLRRFLSHLFSTLQSVTESTAIELGQDALEILQGAKHIHADELIAPLLNKATSLEQPLCIVLDDYHLISNTDVHDAIDFFLEYAPSRMKLCLLSRSDPPLKLSRLRARAQLIELRTADLRFTDEETSHFLTKNTHLNLSDTNTLALAKRAEGWAVGLQVMALSLTNTANPNALIQELSSSNRFLLDYLLDEVLDQQSKEVQIFLLKTSVLDTFNASLCASLLDPEDLNIYPKDMIIKLERANLFLMPLDGHHNWFRYHHLFKDVLLHRLTHLHPELIKPLRASAASWFEQNGFVTEATEQLLKAKLFEEAAELILRLGYTLIWKQGDARTLNRWLEKLPSELTGTRPSLLLLQAWVCHVLGDLHRIEPLLDEVNMLLEVFETEDTEVLKAESTALRSFIKRMQGELDKALELSQEALTHLAERARQLRSLVNGNLGEIYYLKGNFKDAHDYHKEESRLAEKEGAVLPSRHALWRISDIQTQKGQLELAKKTCLMMLNLNKVRSVDALGFADVQLGIIALEQHNLAEADKRLSSGIEMGKRLSNPRVFMPGYGPLAKLLLVTQRVDEAQEILDEAQELSESHAISWTWGVPLVDAWQAYFDLRTQKLDKAYLWAEQTGLITAETPINFLQEFPALIVIRILLAKNLNTQALDLLQRVETSLATTSCIRNRVEIDLLKALALNVLGQNAKALDSIEAAILRASDNGHCLSFIDEGVAMKQLIQSLKDNNRQVAYCTKLLAAFPEEQMRQVNAEPLKTGMTDSPQLPEEVEELSDRELTVLRLIAGRLSNKEIAKELDLSTNTIKWYAKSIFEKLKVHGRLKAGQKAKELGLL